MYPDKLCKSIMEGLFKHINHDVRIDRRSTMGKMQDESSITEVCFKEVNSVYSGRYYDDIS